MHLPKLKKRQKAFVCAAWSGNGRQRVSAVLKDLSLSINSEVGFAGWCLISALSRSVYGAIYNATSAAPLVTETPREKVVYKTETVREYFSDEDFERIVSAVKNSFNNRKEVNSDELLNKVLNDNNIRNVINNYNTLSTNIDRSTTIFNEYKSTHEKTIDDLKQEIRTLKLEVENLGKSKEDIVAQFRAENSAHRVLLNRQLNKCCRRSLIDIESYILKVVNDAFKNPGENLSRDLRKLFVARDELESRLGNLSKNVDDNVKKLIESNVKMIMEDVATRVTVGGSSGDLSESYIKRIVDEALATYDADKTGLVDYAMEPMGGQVLSTKCTENYQAGTAVISILGIPLWYPSNTPRTVITPGINPGECWAFQNFPGFLVVKLAMPIRIRAFSYEHISRKLVPGGKIDSAPKEFEVFGLRNETDKYPVFLGNFRYDGDREPLQMFASGNDDVVFDMIEIRVLSNHGNPNYTCLYRFRVHGSVSGEPT